MTENTSAKAIELQRDCDALLIPSGLPLVLPAGSRVVIRQALGDTYTVDTGRYLVRIDQRDADALGMAASTASESASAAEVEDVPVDEEALRAQLRTCYDPEIPVNILDLGLIYQCKVMPHPEGGSLVRVKMTLTAPGCGMGEVLAADVQSKLRRVPGVRAVEVELVFDPPWDISRASEAARLKLGLL